MILGWPVIAKQRKRKSDTVAQDVLYALGQFVLFCFVLLFTWKIFLILLMGDFNFFFSFLDDRAFLLSDK